MCAKFDTCIRFGNTLDIFEGLPTPLLYKNPTSYFIILASSAKTKEVEVIEFHRKEKAENNTLGLYIAPNILRMV